MTFATILPFVLGAVALGGNWLINKRLRTGFLLWMVSNSGWIAFNLWLGVWGAAAMFTAFLVLSVHGFVTWGKIHDRA